MFRVKMFKVGDRVRVTWNKLAMENNNGYDGSLDFGDEDIVVGVYPATEYLILSKDRYLNRNSAIPMDAVELVESAKTPRPHADLIKRWADDDSLEVQINGAPGVWLNISNPHWDPKSEYRFKPKSNIDKDFVKNADDKTLLELLMHELTHRLTQEYLKKKK